MGTREEKLTGPNVGSFPRCQHHYREEVLPFPKARGSIQVAVKGTMGTAFGPEKVVLAPCRGSWRNSGEQEGLG